jgi:HSP90 family molecular chaperone
MTCECREKVRFETLLLVRMMWLRSQTAGEFTQRLQEETSSALTKVLLKDAGSGMTEREIEQEIISIADTLREKHLAEELTKRGNKRND